MNAIVLGRRRQGKSTLALWLARLRHQNVIVFDPNRQYRSLASVRTVSGLERWMERGAKSEIIAYVPVAGAIYDDFEAVGDLLWKYGNYSFVIDEAATLQRSHYLHPTLERYIRQAPRDGERNQSGEPVGVSIIQTTHRMVDINPVCRALATDYFFFRTTLPLDLNYIGKQWGESVVNALSALKEHECVHLWQGSNGADIWRVWSDPSVWFLPIGSTNTERG